MVQNPVQKTFQSSGPRPSTVSVNNRTRPAVAGVRPAPSGVRPTPNTVRPTISSAPQGNNRNNASPDNQNMVYINDKIKAFEVVVITEDGENLGKMKRFDALALAQEQWLDLVQLSYNPIEKVCTAKITDFGKYMYEKKKTTKEKKKTANKGMKQMKFAYGIWNNDLLLKIKKMKEMLDEGYVVRVFAQLRGRENIYKDKIIEKLIFVQEELKDIAKTQSPLPKQDKNTFSFIFMGLSKK